MFRSKFFKALTFMIVLAVAFSIVSPAAAQPSIESKNASVKDSPNGIYLVELADAPVVASSTR